MRLKIIQILAAAMTIALLVAGCGSSDDSTSSLTKSQFVKQAEAICKQADEDQFSAMAAAEKKVSKGLQGGEVGGQSILLAALRVTQREAEEIGELGAPDGDEDEVEAIVTGIEDAVRDVEEDPTASNSEAAFAEVDRQAKAYGFKECSEAL